MIIYVFVQELSLLVVESERGEPVAADLVVVENEIAGKGRKRPSLAVAGRGRRAVKRAREPAVLEVTILYIISWIRKCGTAICSCIRLFIKTNTRI